MSNNAFIPRKFEDFTIVTDDGKRTTVGHVRIKPSGILWAPKGSQVWYGVSLSQFEEYITANGKRQKQ